MSEYNISFSATSSHDGGSFKLIELPPELLNLVESAIENANPLRCIFIPADSNHIYSNLPISLAIKGQQGEDAVLCTSNKTYAMRSTVLSNTVLVVAPPSDVSREQFEDDDTVVIRDQVNEVVELVPAVPKLHKLGAVLRGREYNEGEADRDEDDASHPVRVLGCSSFFCDLGASPWRCVLDSGRSIHMTMRGWVSRRATTSCIGG